MGLSAGGLIRWGRGLGKAKKRQVRRQPLTTGIIRQNENLYLKNFEKYRTIRLFIHSRKFIPDIVALWVKNWNQQVHGRAYVYVCVCGGGGGGEGTWNNTNIVS